MTFTRWSLGLGAMALCAAPALADSLESRVARVEQQLAAQSAPSAREIQSAVDAYLASGSADASLVGGPGQAGYDGGFWIRGGTFLLKINLTLQARYEYFDWDDSEAEPSPGGDLSGFSLPRATLKFSGDPTCDVHYYAELEFGHEGDHYYRPLNAVPLPTPQGPTNGIERYDGGDDPIKMEPELRDQFMAVAVAAHRPAAEIVRDLMRSYIARQVTPNAETIAAIEAVHRGEYLIDPIIAARVLSEFHLTIPDQNRSAPLTEGEMRRLAPGGSRCR